MQTWTLEVHFAKDNELLRDGDKKIVIEGIGSQKIWDLVGNESVRCVRGKAKK